MSQWILKGRRLRVAALAIACCWSSVACGNSIVVGNHNLLPNTPGQVVNLYMTGTDAYVATDVYTLINGGSSGAPVVTHVFGDTDGAIPSGNLSGSIWASGWGGIVGGSGGTTTTGSGLMTGAGLLVAGLTPTTTMGLYLSLTFDTTGVSPGQYSFELTEYTTLNVGLDEEFEPIYVPLSITNGTLTVLDDDDVLPAPEPSAIVSGGLALVGLIAVIRRRRRRSHR